MSPRASVRPAPGGGRVVSVEPERLVGWFERFATNNGGVASTATTSSTVLVRTAGGTTAEVAVPFRPLAAPVGERDGLAVDELVEHVLRPRRIALLLVRLGGYSVGVATAEKVLVSSTDRRQVHGRNRKGGSSSGRFARRREGQARVALRAAADTTARVLLPRLAEVDAVVLGGDRLAIDQLREDPRLAPLFERAEPGLLDVPEPRYVVLVEAARLARLVEITVRDP